MQNICSTYLFNLYQLFVTLNFKYLPFPELFFTDPKELKDYFYYMEELNANIMSNAMMLQEENKQLNKFFKDLKVSNIRLDQTVLTQLVFWASDKFRITHGYRLQQVFCFLQIYS